MQNGEPAPGAQSAREYFSRLFWLEQAKATSARRLAAIFRVLLALFALLAIRMDSSQPTRHNEIGYVILATFVVYSGRLVTLSGGFVLSHPAAHLVPGIDKVTFGMVLYQADKPTTSFSVLLSFALFAATIRWACAGRLCTIPRYLSDWRGWPQIEFLAPRGGQCNSTTSSNDGGTGNREGGRHDDAARGD